MGRCRQRWGPGSRRGVLGVGLFLYMQQEDGSLLEDGLNRGMPSGRDGMFAGSRPSITTRTMTSICSWPHRDDMDTVAYENSC